MKTLHVATHCLAAWALLGAAYAAPPSTPAPTAAAAPAVPDGPPKPSPISGAAAEALRRGRALAEKGEYPEATKALKEALALAPNDAAVLSELGWVEYQNRDQEEAEKHTRAAIALSTTPALRAASLYNLGLILEERDDRAGALKAYRDSYRERPSSAAKWAMDILEPPAPLDTAKLRRQIDADFAQLFQQMDVMYAELSRDEKVNGYFVSSGKRVLDPLGARANKRDELIRRGRELAAQGKFDQARQALLNARALADKYSKTELGITLELAWISFRRNDFDSAKKFTGQAFSNDPGLNAAGYYVLGHILEARQNNEAAITAYLNSERAQSNSVAQKGLERLDPVLAQMLSMRRSGEPIFPEITSSADARVRLCPTAHRVKLLYEGMYEQQNPPRGFCDCKSLEGLQLAGTPFLAAQLWHGRWDNHLSTNHLALRTRRGWSLVELSGDYYFRNSHADVETYVTGPTATPQGPTLKVRTIETEYSRDEEPGKRERTFFIGIGPSGAPVVIEK